MKAQDFKRKISKEIALDSQIHSHFLSTLFPFLSGLQMNASSICQVQDWASSVCPLSIWLLAALQPPTLPTPISSLSLIEVPKPDL